MSCCIMAAIAKQERTRRLGACRAAVVVVGWIFQCANIRARPMAIDDPQGAIEVQLKAEERAASPLHRHLARVLELLPAGL